MNFRSVNAFPRAISGLRRARQRALHVAFLLALTLAAPAVSKTWAESDRYPGYGSWSPPERKFRLGVNLSPLRRWGAEQPFVNVMKSAGPFQPVCVAADGCGSGNAAESFVVDADGYPTDNIPAAADAKGWDRAQAAPLLHDQGNYRRDRFVVLYDGEGELAYGAGIRRLVQSKGRESIHYENPNGGFLSIAKTNPSNPIRNIRVVAEEFEDTYESQPFDPQFLRVLEPFSVIRFMDWMQTNHSPANEWEDRPKLDDHTWMKSGVPVEMMVRLANTLQTDPWFTLPHDATEQYQSEFARYVREHLHPSLTAYFELSNEVWNDIFPQTTWAKDLGDRGSAETQAYSISQNYGYQAAKMCRAVRPLFRDGDAKFKCVAATHTGWPERAEYVLDCPGYADETDAPCYRFGGFDALAVTTYFGNIIGQDKNADNDAYRHVKSLRADGDDAARSAMIDYLLTGEGWYNDDRRDLPETFAKIDRLTKYAKDRGLELIAYEGGTHLVAAGNIHEDEDMLSWIQSVNRDERMYELYQDMFNRWAEDSARTLICHYSSVASHGKWGSFGLLENMWESPTPRYRAALDFINGELE